MNPTRTKGGWLRSESSGHKKKSTVVVDISDCKYPIVQQAVEFCGWKAVGDTRRDEWNLYWTDRSNLSRKKQLAMNLQDMQEQFPDDYDFIPETWVLPKDWSDFQSHMLLHKGKNRTYIVKPDYSSQGKGIFLTKSAQQINPLLPQVIQRYISNPLLIEGYKFDMRVYVLVRSVLPLIVYVYDDGLVRVCSTKYKAPSKSNIAKSTMHLTNYSLNKHNPEFIDPDITMDDNAGSKRSIKWLKAWLDDQGKDSTSMWNEVKNCIVKTLICSQPALAQTYKSCVNEPKRLSLPCFEVLGFDIMLDSKLKPWVIEVNHSPSFSGPSVLDEKIKMGLLSNTLKMLNLSKHDRSRAKRNSRKQAQTRLYRNQPAFTDESDTLEEKLDQIHRNMEKIEEANLGNFDRAYPPMQGPDSRFLGEQYDNFLWWANLVYEKKTGCKKPKLPRYIAAPSRERQTSSSWKQNVSPRVSAVSPGGNIHLNRLSLTTNNTINRTSGINEGQRSLNRPTLF